MFKLLLNWYYNTFVDTPKVSTINLTGVVKSDHPRIGNGWIKGWVVDNGRNDTVIVCKHSNPSVTAPNNIVFTQSANGQKYTRKIVAIDNVKVKDYDLDIAICIIDSPFPSDIVAYKFAEKLRRGQNAFTPNQHGTITKANIRMYAKRCEVYGHRRDHKLTFGDSGLPWFVWEDNEWKVATHTYRGSYGIGPWYSYKTLYSVLKEKLK